MKVRVPKELRPPERFKPFVDEIGAFGLQKGIQYKVIGKFREPKIGEYFWANTQKVMRDDYATGYGPRVILERVT